MHIFFQVKTLFQGVLPRKWSWDWTAVTYSMSLLTRLSWGTVTNCNKTLTQDTFIPPPLATLLLSQNEIRLTQHSLFPVNLYRQGASHYDPVICKTDRAVCDNCIQCTGGELPGWQFQKSLGREVQYLPSSSLLEIPWPPGGLENITHGAEITMAHPLNPLQYISSGLVNLSTLIYKNIPCSLPFLAYSLHDNCWQ